MAVADLALSDRGAAARTAEPSSMRWARAYFAALGAIGLAAFILGVENRFTSDGLFSLPPPVDWIPPLSSQRWFEAFAAHQQDPAFTACGGTESLPQFKLLYWWEWLRRASVLALAGTAGIGVVGAAVAPGFRFVLPRLAALCGLAIFYWSARLIVGVAVGNIDVIAHFNVGQYQRALDVCCASAALAVALTSAISPPPPFALQRLRMSRAAWFWIAAIMIDVASGALFAARDAAAFWPTWPFYQQRLAPPLADLFSYSPLWLNLTVNHYTIQLLHRVLSSGLWLAALLFVISARRDPPRLKCAVTIFVLLSAEMAAGIFTLTLGVPPALSVVHQIGGAVLLAGISVSFSVVSGAATGIIPRRPNGPGRH